MAGDDSDGLGKPTSKGKKLKVGNCTELRAGWAIECIVGQDW